MPPAPQPLQKPRPAEPIPCPWCGYDVSWLPKGMVCPECGGRQSPMDFAFAAQTERDAWLKSWILVLLAPGCGVWLGLVIEQFAWVVGGVHPGIIAAMPLVLWLIAVLVAVIAPGGRSREVMPALRRRQWWLFAWVAGGSLVIAAGLVWAWLNMTRLGAMLNMINIGATHAVMTLLVSFFGIASGLLWALPLMRVRRA